MAKLSLEKYFLHSRQHTKKVKGARQKLKDEINSKFEQLYAKHTEGPITPHVLSGLAVLAALNMESRFDKVVDQITDDDVYKRLIDLEKTPMFVIQELFCALLSLYCKLKQFQQGIMGEQSGFEMNAIHNKIIELSNLISHDLSFDSDEDTFTRKQKYQIKHQNKKNSDPIARKLTYDEKVK